MHPIKSNYYVEPRGGHEAGNLLFSAVGLIFWAAVIFGLVVLIGKFVSHTASKNQPLVETPLDIAKSRYAKGEITKDEFAQLKKDLS